ncbi:MAG: hypothetical protein GY697_22865 [Desulfobacterales bacterium]|nr:hypothetical protein [Desulfobacterales bacterium]
MNAIFRRLKCYYLFQVLILAILPILIPVIGNCDQTSSCSRAKTFAEKIVCQNIGLTFLDASIQHNYDLAMAVSDEKKKRTLLSEQENWLAKLDKCTSKGCVIANYARRNAALLKYGNSIFRGVSKTAPLIVDQSRLPTMPTRLALSYNKRFLILEAAGFGKVLDLKEKFVVYNLIGHSFGFTRDSKRVFFYDISNEKIMTFLNLDSGETVSFDGGDNLDIEIIEELDWGFAPLSPKYRGAHGKFVNYITGEVSEDFAVGISHINVHSVKFFFDKKNSTLNVSASNDVRPDKTCWASFDLSQKKMIGLWDANPKSGKRMRTYKPLMSQNAFMKKPAIKEFISSRAIRNSIRFFSPRTYQDDSASGTLTSELRRGIRIDRVPGNSESSYKTVKAILSQYGISFEKDPRILEPFLKMKSMNGQARYEFEAPGRQKQQIDFCDYYYFCRGGKNESHNNYIALDDNRPVFFDGNNLVASFTNASGGASTIFAQKQLEHIDLASKSAVTMRETEMEYGDGIATEHLSKYALFAIPNDSHNVGIVDYEKRLLYSYNFKTKKHARFNGLPFYEPATFFFDKNAEFIIQISASGKFAVTHKWKNRRFWGIVKNGEYVLYDSNCFFDSTPEGSDLVVFRFQNPLRIASFASFERVYKRRQIVANRFAGMRDTTLVIPKRLACPLVEIDEHKQTIKTQSGQLAINAFFPKTDVQSLHVFLNGKPVQKINTKQKREARIIIKSLQGMGPNKVTLIGFNKFGIASSPRYFDVENVASQENLSNLHLLCVGISDYPHLKDTWQLNFAHKDAQTLAGVFKAQEGNLFGRVDSTIIVNKEANQHTILNAIKNLRQSTPNDIVIILLAGHGIVDSDGKFHFLTSASQTQDLKRGSVDWKLLSQEISQLSARVVIFLDACHSARIVNESISPNNTLAEQLFSGDKGGVIVFSASKGRQVSYESSAVGNGAGYFTHALVQGITKRAREADSDDNGYIEIMELVDYVRLAVEEGTYGQQTPWLTRVALFGDFPIAKYRSITGAK